MNIGFFGDGPWAQLALKKIIAQHSFRIVYIVARHDNMDHVLSDYAHQLNVPFFRNANVNDPGFISKLLQYAPDINISMSFNQILRLKIITLAPLGFINCHAGLLPFYRGRNILNWALINGEKEFGVTVHYIDEGIDTGDIIIQQKSEILPTDDYGDVLEKAYTLCAETLLKALLLIFQKNVHPISQSTIHPVGFYCGRRQYGDEYIEWDMKSERIFNFIRSLSFPGPGARLICNGLTYIAWKAELIPLAPNYIATIAEVVGRDASGVIVKTGDSTIKLQLISSVTEGNEVSGQRSIPQFPIGTRFSNRNEFVLQSAIEEIRLLNLRVTKLEKLIQLKN